MHVQRPTFTIAEHPDRDLIDQLIDEGVKGADLSLRWPELTRVQFNGYARKRRNRLGGTPAPSRDRVAADEPSVQAKLGRDGSGEVWFHNWNRIPSEADMRALHEHMGNNPDDFEWWVETFGFDSAGWLRDRDDAKHPDSIAHKNSSAYTGEKRSFRVRTERRTAKSSPIVLERPAPTKVRIYKPRFAMVSSDWQQWILTPDPQIGYHRDRNGEYHTIHDERAFDVAHQAACMLRDDGGLHGWADAGDFLDYSQLSRFDSSQAHIGADLMNLAHARGDRELGERRAVVGPDGPVIIAGANHDRWAAWLKRIKAQNLQQMERPRHEERYPPFSAPWWVNAEEHGVHWGVGYPNSYYALNSNLVVMHAPVMASQAAGTARKIAERVHASVYFGHIHRRERIAVNTHDPEKGTRTFEVWSDGCLARTDGAVPGSGGEDNFGEPVLATAGVSEGEGSIGPNWHQGFTIARVERGGRERFEINQVSIWDGWAALGGQEITARCDADGSPLS